MKCKYIYLIFLMSTNILAEVFPNFDTSTNVVTIPKVRVDNTKDKTYRDVELLLRKEGTWTILAINKQEAVDLTGNWKGILGDPGVFVPGHTQIMGFSLKQKGSKLTGVASFGVRCSFDSCTNGIINGAVTGTVDGNNITLEVVSSDSDRVVNLDGIISSDYRKLGYGSEWVLNLQD